MEDPIDLVIIQGVLEVLVLCVVVKVVIKARVIDSVYIYMSVGAGEGFFEEGIMPLGRVDIPQLVAGFRDGQSLFCPVNSGICDMKSRESKDDIFMSAPHDIEKVFMSDSFYVGVEGASEANSTSFVCSLVDITNGNGGGKFFHGEVMFSDKLPVDARDVSTGVYQHRGVNDFEGVRRGDQLNRDTHRFI